MDTAQVDTYDEVKRVVEAVCPYREYQRCSSALLCMYGCYYNTGTTHKSQTLNVPPAGLLFFFLYILFIINSFDSENKQNWNANKRAETAHAHVSSHTHTHAHSHVQCIIHTERNKQKKINLIRTYTKIQLLFLREHQHSVGERERGIIQ